MLQNLHTHTTFCDGRDTPEEMVNHAIGLGFDSLGFSGHARTRFFEDYETRDMDGYIAEIKRLQTEYADKIEILLGVEMDYYSVGITDTSPFEYKIASVHTAEYKNDILYYDLSAERTREQIEKYFDGDGTAFALTYFEKVAELPYIMDADFIGHFDIVTKFSEKHPELIDTNSGKYRDAALNALHTVIRKNEFFEVNTGAIGRGYRTTPYPAPFILDEMRALGAKLVLTSDCHNKNFLDVGFREARQLISAAGFDTVYRLTRGGFVGEKL